LLARRESPGQQAWHEIAAALPDWTRRDGAVGKSSPRRLRTAPGIAHERQRGDELLRACWLATEPPRANVLAGIALLPLRTRSVMSDEPATWGGAGIDQADHHTHHPRLERGDMNGVSESVLGTLAGALLLDDAERAHLFDLARAAQATPARPHHRNAKQRVRPEGHDR
jgi:hypothetical protein